MRPGLKKIYRVDFEQLDAEGFLKKIEVADLLDIEDPHDLNRGGSQNFTFPFWTIEGSRGGGPEDARHRE